jgi:hypothetical protein
LNKTAPGKNRPIAFATWHGSRRDLNGQKAVTTWYRPLIQLGKDTSISLSRLPSPMADRAVIQPEGGLAVMASPTLTIGLHAGVTDPFVLGRRPFFQDLE